MPIRRNSRQDTQLHKLRVGDGDNCVSLPWLVPPSKRIVDVDIDVDIDVDDDVEEEEDRLSTIHSDGGSSSNIFRVQFSEDVDVRPAVFDLEHEDIKTLWYNRFDFMRMRHDQYKSRQENGDNDGGDDDDDDYDENDDPVFYAIEAVLNEQDRQRSSGGMGYYNAAAIAAEYTARTLGCLEKALQNAKEHREAALCEDDDDMMNDNNKQDGKVLEHDYDDEDL
eukprot:CAMPEP_0116555378 /NCGR_PEP_ID=MMETSP0397-20121206/8119_1 /TAXON_ID=216820 /ORGANISM="Cyclophora tenuis, Strain ECT3854" /LENGTH=222 /DNA_ID=CAMNT_0004080653 /DNA_START=47 /DNA_END=716 /DNA_ORIENTATION=-